MDAREVPRARISRELGMSRNTVAKHAEMRDMPPAALGEREGETRLYYCDSRRADQKGDCGRNHSEIRKMPPKGPGGVSFDTIGGRRLRARNERGQL